MHTKVSWLGIFLCLPAFAGARLPAVNVSAAAVSARSEFGVPVQNAPVATKTVAKNTAAKKATRRVVARTSVAPKTSANVSKDTGEKIALNSDYLIPNKPSSDLWAKNDTPLRMPRADEFSLISSNDILPEESLSGVSVSDAYSSVSAPRTKKTKIGKIVKSKKASTVPAVSVPEDEVAELTNRVSNLDAQIARLIELQRRAEASVSDKKSVKEIETLDVARADNVQDFEHESVSQKIASNDSDDDVKLSRMVVSRNDDASPVVRTAARSKNYDIHAVRDDMTKLSPAELRKAFRKTFLSENKHLSTYSMDDRFDVASDISSSFEGFTSSRDLSEEDKIRPLEIKIKFRSADSALSRENYNLLSEYAGIVVNNPKRAIQVAIPESVTKTSSGRKLAARRLAIIEQVLRDTGVAEQRVVPVLSARDDEGFLLRIISNDQYETLTKQKRNMFGDAVDSKTYKSMSW